VNLRGILATALGAAAFALAAAPRLSADDVLAALKPGHPRLLFDDAQLAAAAAAARTDPVRAQLHARILEEAAAILPQKPIERVLVGPRLLDKSRACVARVLTCAMAFRLSGDARFAARAEEEMRAAAAFSDWNPSHFLDVAEMSFALAIGYDWLYPHLSAEGRAAIRRALLEKGLVFAPAAYAVGGPTDKRLWFVTADHNWNQVCNGGLLAAALALADEEPDLARQVVAGAVRSLPVAMAAYRPIGGFPEGPGYWGYGTGYNVIAIALLDGALGRDFGLAEAPGFDHTALYRLCVTGPTGLAFNYADGAEQLGDSDNPQYTWLGLRFHLLNVLEDSRRRLAEDVRLPRRHGDGHRLSALNAVWFPSAPAEKNVFPVWTLDNFFPGAAQIAVFRTAWNDPRALFVGFKAGSNAVNHAHLDLGSFVLDADGVRWASDLGPDNYDLPGYFGAKRWSYYRLNNRSHNVVTPGDLLQDPKANAPIIGFGGTLRRRYAMADLVDVYPGTCRRMLRGIAVLDASRVLVQDDIDGLKAGMPLAWRMLTVAEARLEGPRTAILSRQGRTLKCEILSPEGVGFALAPARPPTADENPNKGVTEVRIDIPPGSDSVRIAVLLTPQGDRWPSAQEPPRLTPVLRWE
jgi:hypothetical protein